MSELAPLPPLNDRNLCSCVRERLRKQPRRAFFQNAIGIEKRVYRARGVEPIAHEPGVEWEVRALGFDRVVMVLTMTPLNDNES